jgi:predicted transglutaminase-like cysteine proteinase
MRQIAHLYMATVAAALAMSCALPYATRASLDPNGLPEVAVPRISSEMPAAAPVEFVIFPRGTINFDAKWQSIDLSMTTPQGFLALSKNLSTETEWASVALPVIAARPTAQPATVHSNGPETFHTLPKQIEANVDRIAFNKPVLAPVAFVRFCMRYQDDCKASPMGFDRALVPFTKARWAELAKVNNDVNRAIKPEANLGGVMAEEWLVAPRRGDCNDYAVTKRHELLARGWPSHSLLLTEVVVASGEHHLVLVVRTSEDDFVLDNLNGAVRPVSQIKYQWVRAQQAENPKFWSAINVARVDRVAMNSQLKQN